MKDLASVKMQKINEAITLSNWIVQPDDGSALHSRGTLFSE
jgi:hypothetical protein